MAGYPGFLHLLFNIYSYVNKAIVEYRMIHWTGNRFFSKCLKLFPFTERKRSRTPKKLRLQDDLLDNGGNDNSNNININGSGNSIGSFDSIDYEERPRSF